MSEAVTQRLRPVGCRIANREADSRHLQQCAIEQSVKVQSMRDGCSAKAYAGDFMKKRSVPLAGMTAFNFF